jgi:hypothetical protein
VPLRRFAKREILPGPLEGAELEAFIRNATVSHSHQTCTAKMGRDAMSVVDHRLRVYGIKKLRIARTDRSCRALLPVILWRPALSSASALARSPSEMRLRLTAHAKAQAATARLDLALLPLTTSFKILSSASAFLYGCSNVTLRLIGDA